MGGNEDLEAVDFIKQLNKAIYSAYPDVQTIAEESTAWPMVSRPNTYRGPRLWYEVEYGMDARHIEVFLKGPYS